MNAERDISNLKREQLLDDYLSIARKRKGALVATALRNQSVSLRDVLAHGALHSAKSSEELKSALLFGVDIGPDIADTALLGELGRLVLLQNLLAEDLDYGGRLLSLAYRHDKSALKLDDIRVLIQHYIATGKFTEAEMLLDENPKIDEESFGFLRAELSNPFLSAPGTSLTGWLELFNKPFRYHGLAPVQLNSRSELEPFDRLATPRDEETLVHEQPLVSIVITTLKPDETRLTTSINSLLQQSWQNIEIIVVDDGSGPDYRSVFDTVSQLDPRIAVIHQATNMGTYAARNVGYTASQGIYIAGQDDDDWSHPQRIETQVTLLENNPQLAGCRVSAILADENLNRNRIGYRPVGPNASSLMIRREVHEVTGGFLETKKAADTEYFYRASKITGRPIQTLKEPLTIVRILSSSLSRSDFGPGWRHTSRRSFRSSYKFWHENARGEELTLQPGRTPHVHVPHHLRMQSGLKDRSRYDVVFAGDWENYGGPQKSMLEEISALTRIDLRLGVMHLEAARFMHRGGERSLNPAVQGIINEGAVAELHYDDDVEVDLLILRYPPILQFFRHAPSKLRVKKMIILANQAPSELDGRDIRYLVDECHHNAEQAFGVSPLWVPQGPHVRKFLEHYLTAPTLADFNIPGILDFDEWWHKRLWYRSTYPVVGRHSRDDVMKWPESRDAITTLYPLDGQYDVRIMGGAKIPLKILGTRELPQGWTVYERDEIPVLDFLRSLDYFVFFQHSQAVEAFGRAVLEAIASGVVVILPDKFREVFGEAALYSEVEDVNNLIQYLHSDFTGYQSQLARARACASEQFSYHAYQRRITQIIKTSKADRL